MMTRKDYVRVAENLSSYKDLIDEFTFEDLVDDFGAFFAEDNPRFDAQRFLDACLKDSEFAL